MINRYPFNDDLFWTTLVGVVDDFLNTTVEGQGPTLLDRDVNPSDIAFMKNLKLKDMAFVIPAHSATFSIMNNNSDESLDFSNRVPSRGEMRAEILRTQLLLRKKKNPDLTLYEAMDDIFRGDINKSDLLTYLIGGMSYDPTTKKHIPESDKQLIKDIAKKLVKYKKSHPDATENEMIAHGENYLRPSLATKIFGLFLFALGSTLAFAPIPGLAQVVGTWLTAIGVGISAGTITLGLGLAAAAIGLGIFGFASRPNQKSHVTHEENQAALSTVAKQEEDSAVGSSIDNTPIESPVDRDPHDLDGFSDRVNTVHQISEPSELSEQANRLVLSISTDPVTAAKTIAREIATDNTVSNGYEP